MPFPPSDPDDMRSHTDSLADEDSPCDDEDEDDEYGDEVDEDVSFSLEKANGFIKVRHKGYVRQNHLKV